MVDTDELQDLEQIFMLFVRFYHRPPELLTTGPMPAFGDRKPIAA